MMMLILMQLMKLIKLMLMLVIIMVITILEQERYLDISVSKNFIFSIAEKTKTW